MKVIIAHSKKYGNKEVHVDDSDFDVLSKFRWYLSVHKKNMYALTKIKYKHHSMHRMLMGLTDPKILCDHKDGNGLNNQRSNIRQATYGQNSQNKGACHRNLSGYKGVCLNRENKYKKYTAVIIANGKRIFGGGFTTPEDAARRWNEMARQYHGEFAYQNII